MCGGAETEEANLLCRLNTGNAQTAEADDSRTQQGRGVQVIEFGWERINKVAACRGILGITAIDGVASEDGRVAKIFEPAAAVRASSVYSAHPGNTNARAKRQFGCTAFYNIAHNLVAGDKWLLSWRQFSLCDVEIGAADPAGSNPKQNLTGCGLRLGSLFDIKRLFCGFEDGSFHEVGLHLRSRSLPQDSVCILSVSMLLKM